MVDLQSTSWFEHLGKNSKLFVFTWFQTISMSSVSWHVRVHVPGHSDHVYSMINLTWPVLELSEVSNLADTTDSFLLYIELLTFVMWRVVTSCPENNRILITKSSGKIDEIK